MSDKMKNFWDKFEKEAQYFRQMRAQKASFSHWLILVLVVSMVIVHAVSPLTGAIKWAWVVTLSTTVAVNIAYNEVAKHSMIEMFEYLDEMATRKSVEPKQSEPYSTALIMLSTARTVLLISSIVLYTVGHG